MPIECESVTHNKSPFDADNSRINLEYYAMFHYVKMTDRKIPHPSDHDSNLCSYIQTGAGYFLIDKIEYRNQYVG